MNRPTAFLLMCLILVCGFFILNSPGFSDFYSSMGDTVLFTLDDGFVVTVAVLFWIIVVFVIWASLCVAGFMIDPIIGYAIFRFGVDIFLIFIMRGGSSSSSSKGGSGSGRSGRGN